MRGLFMRKLKDFSEDNKKRAKSTLFDKIMITAGDVDEDSNMVYDIKDINLIGGAPSYNDHCLVKQENYEKNDISGGHIKSNPYAFSS